MLIRAMTYNIFEGGTGREAQILDVIRSADPDVVVLQEVLSANLIDWIALELGMKAFFATGNSRKRVVLMSRLPVRSFDSFHPFPLIFRNVIKACVDSLSGQTFFVIGMHAPPILWIGFELWRQWEAQAVISNVLLNGVQPCIVMGDFNAIAPQDRPILMSMPNWLKLLIYAQGKRFYHFAIRSFLSRGLIDCYRSLHPDEDGFTLPATHPNARLDYIFVDPCMLPFLRTCEVIRTPDAVQEASDHCPVMAEFAF